MSVTYRCQSCGCVEACERLYTVPGKTKLGAAVLGQAVCKECYEYSCAAVEQFWTGEEHTRADRCSKCGCHFGSGGSKYAQRKLKEDGSWDLAKVCSRCLDAFHRVCTQAMTD